MVVSCPLIVARWQGSRQSPQTRRRLQHSWCNNKKIRPPITCKPGDLPGHPWSPVDDRSIAKALSYQPIIDGWPGSRHFSRTEAAETIAMVHLLRGGCCCCCCCSRRLAERDSISNVQNSSRRNRYLFEGFWMDERLCVVIGV